MNNPISIHESESIPNGIRFVSSVKPELLCETIILPNGKIESKTLEVKEASDDYLDDFVKILFKIRSIFNLILIILASITLNPWYVLAACIFAFYGSRNFFIILLFIIYNNKKCSDFYHQALFHGAEHKVVNAYTSLGRIPFSIEEIKKFSIISKKCGSRYIFSNVLMTLFSCFSIILFANKNIFFTILLITIIIIFFKLSAKYGFLSFLQVLVLKNPTDRELILALEGIKYFEITEQLLSEIDEDSNTHDRAIKS